MVDAVANILNMIYVVANILNMIDFVANILNMTDCVANIPNMIDVVANIRNMIDVVATSFAISWPLVTRDDGTDRVALNLINVKIVEKILKIYISMNKDLNSIQMLKSLVY